LLDVLGMQQLLVLLVHKLLVILQMLRLLVLLWVALERHLQARHLQILLPLPLVPLLLLLIVTG
jgi:hypothetical protein